MRVSATTHKSNRGLDIEPTFGGARRYRGIALTRETVIAPQCDPPLHDLAGAVGWRSRAVSGEEPVGLWSSDLTVRVAERKGGGVSASRVSAETTREARV